METVLLVALKPDKYHVERMKQTLGYAVSETKYVLMRFRKDHEQDLIDEIRRTYREFDIESVYEVTANRDKGLMTILGSRRLL